MSKFTLGVNDFIGAFEDGAEQVMRATAIKTFNAIIETTPADEGRARASWFATGQQPSTSLPTKNDKDGKATAARSEQKILSLKKWDIFTLTSNLPYIIPLEFGGYPDPVEKGTMIKKGGGRGSKISPTYEKRSAGGYSRQAPEGMVRINMNQSAKLLQQEAARLMPK